MTKQIIGIDPGVTGGISSITLDAGKVPKVQIFKMPEDEDDLFTLLTALVLLPGERKSIWMESVHSSPRMGVVSSFTFGRGVGFLEGVLLTMSSNDASMIVKTVTPQKWQTALNCLTQGDKKISYKRAKELFPDQKGLIKETADSLLIAYYGYMKEVPQVVEGTACITFVNGSTIELK